jgi:hypothetical protein
MEVDWNSDEVKNWKTDCEIMATIDAELDEEETLVHKNMKEASIALHGFLVKKRNLLADAFDREWPAMTWASLQEEVEYPDGSSLSPYPDWAGCVRVDGDLSEDMLWVVDEAIEAMCMAEKDGLK